MWMDLDGITGYDLVTDFSSLSVLFARASQKFLYSEAGCC